MLLSWTFRLIENSSRTRSLGRIICRRLEVLLLVPGREHSPLNTRGNTKFLGTPVVLPLVDRLIVLQGSRKEMNALILDFGLMGDF